MKGFSWAAALAACLSPIGPVAAKPPTHTASVVTADFGMETFRLWQGRAPGAMSDDAAEVPTLTLFRPQPGTENGTAVIVAPGGGYTMLASILEGRQVADWFASRGIAAFVLTYRVGTKARLPIPLFDGARAVRYVRANAARFRIGADRIGMIGFSAGGHLAATTAGRADPGNPTSPDEVERASSKPDFVVLGYPWLEGTTILPAGYSQYCSFLRAACDPKEYVQYRPTTDVTSNFPPTFIYHTTADTLVRADGVVTFYQALLAKKVPVEMHIFANGPHGTGMGGADRALSQWPQLLDEWLRGRGLLTKPN
jgi:acetyl esterase/lipase